MSAATAGTRRMTLRAALAAWLLAAGGFVAASSGAAAPAGPATASLRSFESCPALLTHVRTRAAALTGAYGIRGYQDVFPARGMPLRDGAVALPAPAAAAPEGAGTAPTGGDSSGTNVQEAGVDEPDLVKSDGRRLFAVAGGRVRAVDLTGASPREVGGFALAQEGVGAELLLLGDRLLVIESGAGAAAWTSYEPLGGAVRVTALDVSDPAALRPVGTLRMDGHVVGARLTGDAIRLVVSSAPDPLPLAAPAEEDARAVARAAAHNRRVVRRASITRFLPRYTLRRPEAAAVRRLAAPCDEVRAPRRFAGLGMITVLTLGIDPQLVVRDSDAVMTDGELVYASPTNLYVASTRWTDPARAAAADEPPAVSTLVHRLDTSLADRTEYRATGAVPGYLLNQFSMSERDGVLRVASTDVPTWWGDPSAESESYVTALAEREGRLETLGRVGGLGRGERIFAVRFLGDRGYVVTFRQTDPLYVVDLADPAAPRVRGELKIPGFSAYLHPVSDTLLIGVGQDATDEGRTTGTQVSLFDVSDPARPQRVAQRRLGAGWSEAEADHHAFLYWAPTGLLVLPFSDAEVLDGAGSGTGAGPDLGAAALRVQAGAPIAELGRVRHPGDDRYRAAIRRSIVVGADLVTLSEQGLLASDLVTLAPRAWLRFDA